VLIFLNGRNARRAVYALRASGIGAAALKRSDEAFCVARLAREWCFAARN
jgi:hypothetical protein